MAFWNKTPTPHSKTYTKAVARLETVSSDSVVRYLDNTHSHIGQLIALMRKSPREEALQILDEIEQATELIQASVAVLRGSDQ